MSRVMTSVLFLVATGCIVEPCTEDVQTRQWNLSICDDYPADLYRGCLDIRYENMATVIDNLKADGYSCNEAPLNNAFGRRVGSTWTCTKCT